MAGSRGRRNIALIVFSVFMFIAVVDSRGGNKYIFEQISLRQGLSQTTAKTMVRERSGLLWIGTKDGLNRFDGNEMNNYFHDPDDETSLPDNFIYFVNEDPMQNIWVGTGRALARYNRYNDSFEKVNPLNTESEVKYSNSLVIGTSILFGSNTHLAIYDTHRKKFRTVHFNGVETVIPFKYSMVPWHGNTVLIASRWKGLFVCDLNTGELKRTHFLDDPEITSVFLDRYKRLWIGLYNRGVRVFNWKGKELGDYHSENSGLSNDIVLTMCEINEEMWLGTDGGGVNILNPETGQFEHIENIPEDISSIPVNSVFSIYKDELAGIWIGTIRGGLFGVKQVSITTYTGVPLHNKYGLTDPTILSLWEDDDHRIWIGTDGGGLNLLDPDNDTFKHFPQTLKMKVNAIAGISDRKLLLSSFGEGLFIFDKISGGVKHIRHSDPLLKEIPGAGFVGVSLLRTTEQELFVFDNRIHIYDVVRKKITGIDMSKVADGEGGLTVVDRRSDNVLFYGLKGVYHLNLKTKEVEPVVIIDRDSNDNILCACHDMDGIIWVGTSSGLYRVSEDNSELIAVETGHFRSVNSIIAGVDGRLWLGAGGSLFSYYKGDNYFKAYGRSDGVIPNEFLPKPVLTTRSGDTYMGGVAGLVRIRKDQLPVRELQSSPRVIEIREDGALINKKKYELFESLKQITLPWNYNSLRVRVFDKSIDFFNKNYFKYKIDGYSKEFIETSESTLDFSNLPPGEFPVLIMTSTKEGFRSEPEELFRIIVLPPWWRTWWFITLNILLIASLFIYVKYSAFRRGVNKMKQEMVEKERILNKQKIQFLINISHELRTPLTLIYSPLERLINNNPAQEEQKSLHRLMFQQVNYIKNLIDQILDVRKIEKQGGALNPETVALNEWITNTVADFDYQFKEAKMKVVFDLDDQIPSITIDTEKCKKVLSNLIMNALKYASESSELVISSCVKENNKVVVSVKDQGPGIPTNDIDKLFERFYQENKIKGGTGVGLSYSRTLIEMQGGKIGAYNVKPNGAVFYFELPLHFTLNQKDHPEEIVREDQSNEIDREVISGIYPDRNNFLNGLTILIAEDNTELAKYLKHTFKEQFKRVLWAPDGKQALEMIRKEVPDIIISDVMMPEMDGFELCGQIKSDLEISHIPIILLTARKDEEASLLGYKMGADSYLTKPFSIEVLNSVIYNLLVGRMRIKEKYLKTSDNDLLPKEITYSNADELFLSKLNSIILDEIGNPELSVDLLVDRMAMSRATLYAKAKAVLGTGINNYINDFRIKEAIKLLSETDWPIADIAFKTGFTSQSYFSTSFKQFAGMSPLKFRKNKI